MRISKWQSQAPSKGGFWSNDGYPWNSLQIGSDSFGRHNNFTGQWDGLTQTPTLPTSLKALQAHSDPDRLLQSASFNDSNSNWAPSKQIPSINAIHISSNPIKGHSDSLNVSASHSALYSLFKLIHTHSSSYSLFQLIPSHSFLCMLQWVMWKQIIMRLLQVTLLAVMLRYGNKQRLMSHDGVTAKHMCSTRRLPSELSGLQIKTKLLLTTDEHQAAHQGARMARKERCKQHDGAATSQCRSHCGSQLGWVMR